MSSHLMGEAADFSTYLTGSTKRLGPFHVTGISSVQLLAALGPPLGCTWSQRPLPHSWQ